MTVLEPQNVFCVLYPEYPRSKNVAPRLEKPGRRNAAKMRFIMEAFPPSTPWPLYN